jgi:hypothetical protein
MPGEKSLPNAIDETPAGLTRGDFFLTMLYDTGVLLAAVVLRGLSLSLYGWVRSWAPDYRQTWALHALEWILDVGLVAGALLLWSFDLAKRLIIAGRAIAETWRG